MTEDAHTLTILRAAANLMHDDALDRAITAKTSDERECVNAALLASIAVTHYLEALEVLDRPF